MININEVLKNKTFKRFVIFGILITILFLMKSMVNLLLLTFIFSYLMYNTEKLISRLFKKGNRINTKILSVVLFLIVLAGIIYALVNFVPAIFHLTKGVLTQIMKLYNQESRNPIIDYIKPILDNYSDSFASGKGISYIFNTVTNLINVLISLILSVSFVLGKKHIVAFTDKFKTSKISSIYKEIAYFGDKFLNTFGKVIETQIVISFINATISTIALWIMGFPNVLGLGIMVLLFGFIPVAGVIISLGPLSIIAFSIGGVPYVIYVLILVTVIHSLESYILNPKLMSSKTKIPVFYTFIILILSEHFMGTWGLIIGIPIFVFILDVLEVNIKDKDSISTEIV